MSRGRLRSLGLVLLLAGAACGRDPRPDVFLIVLDTVRADHLGAYGYDRDTSPVLDAFAREAVLYRTAIAPGTWTPPSHASLVTGLLPSVHGVDRVDEGVGGGVYALDPGVDTLAERLRAAGWKTAAFLGNGGYLAPVFGLAQGFEKYRIQGLRSVDDLVPAVVGWLERQNDRPLFVFLNVMDAHAPYEPPAPYDRMFPGLLDPPPPRHPQEEIYARGGLPTPAQIAHYVGRYDGEIRHMDDRLGELFAALRRLGRYDDALIVVTADHGEMFGEGGRWGHGGDPVFELVHVPLLVKYPKRSRVGVETRAVSLADVPATILATLGLTPDAGQRPLWEPTAPVIAERIFPGGAARLAVADGVVLSEVRRDGQRQVWVAEREPAAAPADADRLLGDLHRLVDTLPASRRGPVVHPRADTRLADRLRELGYLR